METSTLDAALSANAGAITVFYTVVVLVGLVIDAVILARLRARPLDVRRHASRLFWRPVGDSDALLLMVILAGLFSLTGMAVQPISEWARRAGFEADTVLIVVQSVTFHWMGLVLVGAWLAARGIPWSSAFGIRWSELPRRFTQGLTFLVATMPVLLFYTLIYGLVLEALGREMQPQEVAYAISQMTSPVARIYVFFLTVVLAPLFEEILFRGVVMTVLAKRIGVGTSVLVTSIFFALIHHHTLSYVPLFILSVSLCLSYIYSESLLVPICMHSLFNLVSVTWLFTAG